MSECPDCSNVSIPLSCGHLSCRVCQLKKNPIKDIICNICEKSTKITETEYLYILYLLRKTK
jgi:hypothetical protein